MPRRADLDLRQGLADRAEERVLDQSLPGLSPQGAVHVGEQTFDRAQLPRRRPSGDARARRRRPEMDEVEAEHPFGTMKWMMGRPRFLVRGLKKAGSEWALGVLGYNIKRTIQILGPNRLIEALKARPA